MAPFCDQVPHGVADVRPLEKVYDVIMLPFAGKVERGCSVFIPYVRFSTGVQQNPDDPNKKPPVGVDCRWGNNTVRSCRVPFFNEQNLPQSLCRRQHPARPLTAGGRDADGDPSADAGSEADSQCGEDPLLPGAGGAYRVSRLSTGKVLPEIGLNQIS